MGFPDHTSYLVLSSGERNLTVKVGERLMYRARIHGSVGIQANIDIGDTSIIRKVSASFEYKNNQEPRMPGGDAGSRTYIFEAIQKGTTQIIVQKVFRGTVDSEFVVQVSIVD